MCRLLYDFGFFCSSLLQRSAIERTMAAYSSSVVLMSAFSLCAITVSIDTNTAEREGFEPSRPCGLPLFESGTFDHSDTSTILVIFLELLVARPMLTI